MRRLLPSGLTGRVTLILTLGLLAAQGIDFRAPLKTSPRPQG